MYNHIFVDLTTLTTTRTTLCYRNLVELHEKDASILSQRFGSRQETILHRAALHRRIEMVEFLLELGAIQVVNIVLKIIIYKVKQTKMFLFLL